jgi:hypothetical protein
MWRKSLSEIAWRPRFPRHYSAKEFMHDAARLRDLARLRTRQPLNDAELAELPELRRRIKRADSDSVLVLIIETRLRGGYTFF